MFYASVFLCPMPHGVSYTQFYAAADITLGKSGSFFGIRTTKSKWCGSYGSPV